MFIPPTRFEALRAIINNFDVPLDERARRLGLARGWLFRALVKDQVPPERFDDATNLLAYLQGAEDVATFCPHPRS